MNNIENEFIKKINDVYDKCYGSETFGNVTEFYDEDGVVLMTSTEEGEKITFKFSEGNDEENFEIDRDHDEN